MALAFNASAKQDDTEAKKDKEKKEKVEVVDSLLFWALPLLFSYCRSGRLQELSDRSVPLLESDSSSRCISRSDRGPVCDETREAVKKSLARPNGRIRQWQ
jgi:hypothetical protein